MAERKADEAKKVTRADQLKDREERAAQVDDKQEEPVKEPSSQVDQGIVKRVYDANATIVGKGETLERIEVFLQDGVPEFWWVNVVKLRKVSEEDDEYLLGAKREDYIKKHQKKDDK
jgi:hypothetical protein